MATLNPFELLGADDNDDPTQLIAAAAAAAQKAEAKKAAAAPSGKGTQPLAAAKLPTKPAPPAQAVRESRGGGAPMRDDFGHSERGRGRGGRGYGQNRDFGDNANGFQGGYGGGGSADGAVTGGEADRERGPRPPYRGGGRRVGYRNGEFGDDSDRPPRRNYERHSGTGRGYGMKREGAGRGNWGTATDEVLDQETEEVLKVEEGVPATEKQGEQNDAPTAENKDNKDAAAHEEEEKEEEDKEMTLEEYEKIREEKRKALLALKAEERKVEVDKDLQALQPLSSKKGNDEIFIKLGSDKDKKKEGADRDEHAKKLVSINEFLKPAEGERYYGGRRGRGRGEHGGFRGGYGGGYGRPAAIPSIQDQAQFPTLGGGK